MVRRWLTPLLIALWGLPLAAALALGMARLLAALGDQTGSAALDYVALASALLWVVALAAIVSVLAVERLSGDAD
jgi:hypothetical protein